MAFMRATLFFYSLADLDYISLLFVFVYPKAGHRPTLGLMAGFGAFLTDHFSLPQEEEKMKEMLNTLNISDFISKIVQIIYIYNTYINYRTLHGGFFVTEHSTR